MTKKSRAIQGLPLSVTDLIQRIGRDLRTTRLRRGMSQEDLAKRMFVSRQTLQRIERGDPSVSIGVILSCAFCLDRLDELKDILSTQNDKFGIILENQKRAIQRRVHKGDESPFEQPDF